MSLVSSLAALVVASALPSAAPLATPDPASSAEVHGKARPAAVSVHAHHEGGGRRGARGKTAALATVKPAERADDSGAAKKKDDGKEAAAPAEVTVTRATAETAKSKASRHGHHRHHEAPRPSSPELGHGRPSLPAVPSLSLTMPSSRLPEGGLARAADRAAFAKEAPPPHEKHGCIRNPVGVQRGKEFLEIPLTKCDGSPAPHAIESLSILSRSGVAAVDAKGEGRGEDGKGKDVRSATPEVKRLDARVVERLQVLVDHFEKDGKAPRVAIVSGYKPTAKGLHARGRAIDFTLDGVDLNELLSYCHTLADTGCGLYPGGGFIHLDVREHGAGRVAWIDSGGRANVKPVKSGKATGNRGPKDEEHPATMHADEPSDGGDHDDDDDR